MNRFRNWLLDKLLGNAACQQRAADNADVQNVLVARGWRPPIVTQGGGGSPPPPRPNT